MDDKLFLNSIPAVSQINVLGQQVLSLNGRFNGKEASFSRYDGPLSIALTSSESRWSMEPKGSGRSDLVVEELRLAKAVQVQSLRYNPFNRHRLSFTLQSTTKETSSTGLGSLKLNIGQDPLILKLEKYEIPALNLSGDELELELIPTASDLPPMEIPKDLGVSMNLPDPQTYDSERWFWGDLAVRNVTFESRRSGVDVNDTRQVSTILNGKVSMAEQSVDLEERQFLLLQGEGIQSIVDLLIKSPDLGDGVGSLDKEGVRNSTADFGIDLHFAGRTKQVKIGIDPEFSIRTIESSWLTRIFQSNDVTVGVMSFCSAILVACLSWLLENLFEDA
ncbi:MAG: hypothetical protein AAFX01_12560 [Cyanobacteria bacterium J06638_28]